MTKNADQEWQPEYSRWRHGGWYVHNVRHPGGSCGCVSNNYPDKKWRIACDDRRTELGGPGDYTFPSRDAAARAELALANAAMDALIEGLLSCTSEAQLDKQMQELAETYGYFRHLQEAWDYWHYGRHAEHAKFIGRMGLATLFSVAWKIQSDVIGLEGDELEKAKQQVRLQFTRH